MKPKFRAPSGPRTPDYAPAARRILFLSLLLLFLLLTMGNLQKRREALADRIAPSILRFHILANSDSREDQAVKLEVRSVLDENNDNNVWKGFSRFGAGFVDWRFVSAGNMSTGTDLS